MIATDQDNNAGRQSSQRIGALRETRHHGGRIRAAFHSAVIRLRQLHRHPNPYGLVN